MDIRLFHGDCLEVMKDIPDESVDCIICDLPYSVTACKWDVIIPFEPLWEQYERIIRADGAICLFGTQPFTTRLIASRIDLYRYSWVWVKEKGSNFQLANIQPLKRTEDICVFSKAKSANGAKPRLRYFPILEHRDKPLRYTESNNVKGEILHKNGMKGLNKVYTTKHPTNILEFTKNYGQEVYHPTQKPVHLISYLVRTYTQEGEVVLDNCMGSGSTGVACCLEHRRFIGIELQKKYYDISEKRIKEAMAKPVQGELF